MVPIDFLHGKLTPKIAMKFCISSIEILRWPFAMPPRRVSPTDDVVGVVSESKTERRSAFANAIGVSFCILIWGIDGVTRIRATDRCAGRSRYGSVGRGAAGTRSRPKAPLTAGRRGR